ncbi:MAG: hypothetical protein ACKO6F_07645 [Cyanobium sp.]
MNKTPLLAEQQQLYQRICAYQLDDSSHEIGFLAHLMRANGWSGTFALRAIKEYRKFVFLAMVADHQVTLSDQVDQVWHLHLLFSEAYWSNFCPLVLGRPLHHQPTRGGQAERDRFHTLYRATILSYREHFGEPPADLWPPVEVRFGRDLPMRRGPIREPFRPWRGWRRMLWATTGLLISLRLVCSGIAKAAAGAGSDPPPEGGDELLALLLFLMVSAVCLMGGWATSAGLLRPLILQPSHLATTPQLDDEELALLAGGPIRMLEIALASLVLQRCLRADPGIRRLVLLGQAGAAPPGIAGQILRECRQLALWKPTAAAYPAAVDYGKVTDMSLIRFRSRQKTLQERGLPLRDPARWVALGCAHPCVLIVMFFLLIVCFMPHVPLLAGVLLPPFLLGVGLALRQPSGRTLWGDEVLERYRISSTHADCVRRIALHGSSAMSGEGLDDLRSLIKNLEADIAAAQAAQGGCAC